MTPGDGLPRNVSPDSSRNHDITPDDFRIFAALTSADLLRRQPSDSEIVVVLKWIEEHTGTGFVYHAVLPYGWGKMLVPVP